MKLAMCKFEDGITEEVIKVAHSRTMPLLDKWRLMDYDIRLLLASAYLQGCRDMAETMVKQERTK